MKQVAFVIFTSLIAPLAGAEVAKVRVNAETYRIVLTGQDALRLQASVGERNIKGASGTLESLSCLKTIGRCELTFKNAFLQSFETVQEQVKLASTNGLDVPQLALPRNASEQVMVANIDDPQVAAQLYALLPGPEVEYNIEQSLVPEQFSGKTKTLDLARNDFFISCQQISRTTANGTIKKGYGCVANGIVPSGRE